MSFQKHVTILGGGAWGTALASMAAGLGHKVTLYARDEKTVADINTHHTNRCYLPGIVLPGGLHASADPQQALHKAEYVLAVIPAQSFAASLTEIGRFIPAQAPLIVCSKGIEQTTGRFMSDIAADILPGRPVSALSGPSFATDVAMGLPTAVTLAARDDRLARQLAALFSGQSFRCYASTDLKGVEIGGALKNVLALAAGMSAGHRLGASAQAAIVTRGFAELRRIATTLGGKPDTMTGLSVLGDLILTCSSAQSRNYAYGMALGAGQPTEGLALAEGVATAPVAAALCQRHGIEAPIIHMVADILAGNTSVSQAVAALINRPLKFED